MLIPKLCAYSTIRKSGYRSSEKITLKERVKAKYRINLNRFALVAEPRDTTRNVQPRDSVIALCTPEPTAQSKYRSKRMIPKSLPSDTPSEGGDRFPACAKPWPQLIAPVDASAGEAS
jgi:hypothetical protein